MHQVDRDVLPLRVALEHAFEGELAADAAFFVTAVGVTRALTEALVHLDYIANAQRAGLKPCVYSSSSLIRFRYLFHKVSVHNPAVNRLTFL